MCGYPLVLALSLCLVHTLALMNSTFAADQPNVVIIFCDDLGYGDLGCYGSTKNRTPNIDRLAENGIRLTDFYSSSPVCTPSRSSLMTGCYPRRVGMHEDATGHWVLIPRSRRGLSPDEVTLAEALKEAGYATACIGKWHLGDQPEHLPTAHGFDFYFGIPYSNDMAQERRGDPPLPLVEQTVVIEAPVDQSTLTRRYTEEAVKFIETHQDTPFFLYLPHTFPHLPLHASRDFLGKSQNGRYGDSVEEIDWSTGELMKCLERCGLTDSTLVVFTSDNGSNGRNGGSNKPLSGSKGSTMEGGMRVPMIASLPGRIPAAQVGEQLTTTMDLLPTLCRWCNASPPEKSIDGHDITEILLGNEEVDSPYETFFYYRRRQLQAIRWGDWKWHLPLEKTYPRWSDVTVTGKGRPGKLVNLRADLQEKIDLSNDHPEIMTKMKSLAAQARVDLGDEAKSGAGQRAARTLSSSRPMELSSGL